VGTNVAKSKNWLKPSQWSITPRLVASKACATPKLASVDWMEIKNPFAESYDWPKSACRFHTPGLAQLIRYPPLLKGTLPMAFIVFGKY